MVGGRNEGFMKKLSAKIIKDGVSKLLDGLLIEHKMISQKGSLLIVLKDPVGLYYLPFCFSHLLKDYLKPEDTQSIESDLIHSCGPPEDHIKTTVETLYGTTEKPHLATVYKVRDCYTVAVKMDRILEKGRAGNHYRIARMAIEILRDMPLEQLSTRQLQELVPVHFGFRLAHKDAVGANQVLEDMGILVNNGDLRTRGRDVDHMRLLTVLAELSQPERNKNDA
jgi:hypothetical protein